MPDERPRDVAPHELMRLPVRVDTSGVMTVERLFARVMLAARRAMSEGRGAFVIPTCLVVLEAKEGGADAEGR